MTLSRLIRSKSFLFSALVQLLLSLGFVFLPLVGVLGFESATLMALVLGFVCVFVSAELIVPATKSFPQEGGVLFPLLRVGLACLMIFLIPFVVLFISSIIKSDCFLREGVLFFLLIPLVTVFYSSALGSMFGFLFGAKGFIAGAFVLIITVCFSLLSLYVDLPLTVYNPVFGFFPGPLYDEAIPITFSLVSARLIVLVWGLFFLSLFFAWAARGSGRVSYKNMIAPVAFGAALILGYLNYEALGIHHSRSDIITNHLSSRVETEHFVIYFDPEALDALDKRLIAGDHEWRYEQLKRFLKTNSKEKIRSYVYPDYSSRKRLMGAGNTTVANPINNEIHIVYDEFPHPFLKHELTHVMAGEFGGGILKVSPRVGLIEGLAVAADWEGRGPSPHELSAVLVRSGAAPGISDIIDYGFWYWPSSQSYALMGSFVRFIIDKYGMEQFKDFYRTGNFPLDWKSLGDLEEDWLNFVSDIEVAESGVMMAEHKFVQTSIFETTCPRKVALLREKALEKYRAGEYGAARGHLIKALTYDPNNPYLNQILAYTLYYEGNYEALIGLVEGVELDGYVDRQIFANLIGSAFWQMGQRERAQGMFELLKQNVLPGDIKRSVQIKLSAMETGGEIERIVKTYYSSRDKSRQADLMEELMKLDPDYGPAHFILGSILYSQKRYDLAAEHLLIAEKSTFPSREIWLLGERLLGYTLFTLGRYDESLLRFQRIVADSASNVEKDRGQGFMERINWVKLHDKKGVFN